MATHRSLDILSSFIVMLQLRESSSGFVGHLVQASWFCQGIDLQKHVFPWGSVSLAQPGAEKGHLSSRPEQPKDDEMLLAPQRARASAWTPEHQVKDHEAERQSAASDDTCISSWLKKVSHESD